jgi:Tfp pilus assembly protein PilX
MAKHQQIKVWNNESGLVSLVVTVIIMVVLTLITLSFSQLMRHEETQALDRQLSTQAYYASESGINDTIKDFKAGVAMPPDGNTCYNAPNPSIVSGDSNIAYKCILVNKNPNNLDFSSVDTAQSILTKVQSADLTKNVDNIVISWQGTTSTNTPRPNALGTQLPTVANWGANTIGMVRVSIYPIPPAGANRATLNSLARTFFLYPTDSGGGGSVKLNLNGPGGSAELDGTIKPVDCTFSGGPATDIGPYKCNLSVDISNSGPTSYAGYSYYIRLKSIYSKTSVNIIANDKNGGGTQLNLAGAQVSIDATGAANNVKRRVNARLSQISEYSWPEFAIETTDNICKLLQTAPGSSVSADSAACPLP